MITCFINNNNNKKRTIFHLFNIFLNYINYRMYIWFLYIGFNLSKTRVEEGCDIAYYDDKKKKQLICICIYGIYSKFMNLPYKEPHTISR